MKKISLISIILATGLSAFANPSDIEPSKDVIAPSDVRLVKVLDEGSNTTPIITLVKVDNGGSTDVGTVMCPNRLYLGIHLDGEMNNINGNYEVIGCVDKILSTNYDKKSQTIQITVSNKDNEKLKEQKNSFKIIISEALTEVSTLVEKGDSSGDPQERGINLQSTIGVQAVYR